MNFQFSIFNFQNRDGYAAITATILTLVVALSVIGSFTFFSLKEAASNRAFIKSVESRYVSEAGIEDAVYRIVTGKQLGATETLAVGKGTTTIIYTVAGQTRTIRSEGKRDVYQRNLEAQLNINTTGANFYYGVQVGDGGVEMSNTARINGSFYSNGNIVSENSPVITGDAFVASTSVISGGLTINGSVQAYSILGNPQINIGGSASSTNQIDKTTVGGNAKANIFTNSVINQNAFYKTSITNTTVLGSTVQVSATPDPLPKLPMPISDAQLDQLEQEAEAGGIHTSPCPYILTSGVTILGAKKIACDMDIKSTAQVILTGTLWVAGNLTIQNSAIVRLDPSYGSNSGLIIVHDPVNPSTRGLLDVNNSAQILGSGTAGSYAMLVSRNDSAETGGGLDAIEVQNTSSAPIYYAPHGSVEIHNNANLKEVTAYKLEIRNSAIVTYESGLANLNFSSGPSGGYDLKYWKEAE